MSDDLSGFSLLELFRSEAEGQVAVLNEGLLALEGRPARPEVIEPMMRAAHSLKGAARIVGMAAAERVAHALEDVFVAAQKGRLQLQPDHVDVLLKCVDLLAEISKLPEGSLESWEAENHSRLDDLIGALKEIEAGRNPASTTSVPVGPLSSTAGEPAPLGRPETPSGVDAATVSPEPRRRRRSSRSGPEAAAPTPPPPPAPAETAAPAVEVRPVPSDPAPRKDPSADPAPSPEVARAIAVEPVDRVVRVSADNLNRLMGLAGESLVEARQLRPIVDSLVLLKHLQRDLWDQVQMLEEILTTRAGRESTVERTQVGRIKTQATLCLDELSRRIDRLETHSRRNEDLSERLHHEVISSRLRPFQDGIRGFPRLVRDVARQLEKKVQFEILGEHTGVDRDILEKLEAPLNHLLRNALDHGIEAPGERERAGKPPIASLRLEARHVAGMLQITLTDDGRGIDVERIRGRVVERGMASSEMAAQLTEPELLEFLFLAGFSTRDEVTSLSGRGVGLDVVQSMVQTVGGTVRVTTRLGQGTTFSLQLPITMSVIRALLVTIADEPYAFPLSRLDSIQSVPVEQVEVIEGRQFFKADEQTIGLVSAAQVIERTTTPPAAPTLPVVVISDRGQAFGVVVDEILGERDLDVRPLDPRLGKVPNINSASVLEDGWPVLIFDVEDLVRSIDNLVHGRRLKPSWSRTIADAVKRRVKSVLVVDDSITVRELERQLLESRGYHVETAVDGMDGWNAVRGGHFDLIVSDIDMPRMDGIQFVRQLKQDARFQPIPVVIVSYKDRNEDRLRGLDAGANVYLTKSSFHDATFLETIHDLIGDPRE